MPIDLENRDYTLIIDKSGIMSKKDCEGGRSRWNAMQGTTFALANKCEDFDSDGITIYTFANQFRRYDHVTANEVEQIFLENEPLGRSDMVKVLQDALQNYFLRRGRGQTKSGGETIIMVTGGKPELGSNSAVIQTIIDATHKINREEELAILFIQIGSDAEATQFLKTLDHDLQSAGARFDIVHAITIEEIERDEIPLKELLIRAITN